MFIHIIVLSAMSACFAGNIPYKDCGSTGKIMSIDMSGCTALPCQFYKNQTYALAIKFVSSSNSPSAKNIVYGIIAGVPVPFPLPQEDACKNNITCPIDSGKVYQETLYLEVLPEYPTVSLLVKFEIVDSSASTVACIEFPAKVMNPPSKLVSLLK